MVQIYLRYEGGAFEKPNCSLVFSRIFIGAWKKRRYLLQSAKGNWKALPQEGERKIFSGQYTLMAGGVSPRVGGFIQNGVHFTFVL